MGRFSRVTAGSLRVGIEGSFWGQPMTGTGQYLRALWHELALGGHTVEPVLLVPEHPADPSALPRGAETVAISPPPTFARGHKRKLWWEQVGLARAARRAHVDLVHVPYFAALPRVFKPIVVTIHDLIPWVMPVYATGMAMRLYMRLASRFAKRANVVLTDSDCSARDIGRLLPVEAGRVRVAPLAAASSYRRLPMNDPALDEVRARFGLNGPVLFNVGGLDVRKNIEVLIRAFARAVPGLPAGSKLVVAGTAHSSQASIYPDPAPVARDAGVADRVVFAGRVTDEEKVAFFTLATLYVYPSLYEGFGLSPLEAMRCGTPVLVSNRSSLPEVVGDGGVLAEPDVDSFASAMVTLLNDQARLADLSERGMAQSQRFTWAETARLTALAYRSAVETWAH